MGDVGTKKVFENEKIRIWELFLDPGEKSSIHTHHCDYYFYVVEGSRLEIYSADDELVTVAEPQDGEVQGFQVQGERLVDPSGQLQDVPATHWARNGGKSRYREILVELKT